MKPLKCPKCQGKLATIVYETIEVDRCCHCHGIWFDHTEAESLKKQRGSEQIDLGNPQNVPTKDSMTQMIKCPRCHKKMIKMLDLDQYGIWYEKCLKCQGIWLDAGEFTQFKRNFSGSGLRFPWQNRHKP